jgi:DNA-binding NarL/FixJ family response regulator
VVVPIGKPAEDAARPLFAALEKLYLAAGAPSVRAIADRTRGLSRDTVHRALTSDKPPKWSTLHKIVVALEGDVEQFREWWTAARSNQSDIQVNIGLISQTRAGKTTTLGAIAIMSETENSGALRVAIVDDHAVVREGLRQLFEAEGFEIAGEAADAPDAVSMVLDTQPDAVVMDVRMPSGNGIDATAEILVRRPGTRVLILTSYSDDGAVREAVRVGAMGFLLKQASGHEVVKAVRDVAAGKTYWAHPKAAELAADPANRGRLSERSPQLSQRELQILSLVCEGLTNRQIADRLSINVKTADTYLSRITSKLGTVGRVNTVLYAIKHGLVAGPV